MEQHISKAALVAEIENCINRCNIKKQSCPVNTQVEAICDNKIYAYKELLSFLNTLEVKDVDLEKEIEEYLSTYWPNEKDLHPFLGHMAKHFFELGLSHSVNESIVRKIVDLYFEASKHYDEVIKQERNENGGSQLAIDILSGSKDMKELCVQYVLDKVTKL